MNCSNIMQRIPPDYFAEELIRIEKGMLDQFRIDNLNIKQSNKNNTMNLQECFCYTFFFDYEAKMKDGTRGLKYGNVKLVAANMSEATKMFDRIYLSDSASYSPKSKLHVTNVSEGPIN